ncbi:MAG: Flp family type IVb pilin [Terriglobia bacterium]
MRKALRRLWQEDEGQDLVEYGLLIVLVALASIAAMQTVASAINTVLYTKATSALTSTTS